MTYMINDHFCSRDIMYINQHIHLISVSGAFPQDLAVAWQRFQASAFSAAQWRQRVMAAGGKHQGVRWGMMKQS